MRNEGRPTMGCAGLRGSHGGVAPLCETLVRRPRAPRLSRRGILPLSLGSVLLLPALAAAQPGLEARLLEIEGQLRALSARVEALERHGAGEPTAAPDDDAGGIAWSLGTIVAGEPLRITHKQLDAARGRLDLLVEVTAPLAEPARWSAPNAPVPLAVTLRAADGAARTYTLLLARGTSAEPGARLHLSAELDPAQAAAAQQLIIDRAAD